MYTCYYFVEKRKLLNFEIIKFIIWTKLKPFNLQKPSTYFEKVGINYVFVLKIYNSDQKVEIFKSSYV